MPDCQRCARKTQLFLCGPCTHELRDLLRGLAVGNELDNGRRSRPWLTCLEDAVNGHTRLGESARRSSERNSPLPVHLAASALLDNVKDMLHKWAQHLTIHQGGC